MIIFLKKTKFYIVHNRLTSFVFVFLKNLINLKILNAYFQKKKIYALGNFKSYLNPFIFEELCILDNTKHNDIDYIQSFRNFIDPKTEFYLHKVKSNVLPLFLEKTLKKKVYQFTKKKNFLKEINLNKDQSVLISDNINTLNLNFEKFKYIFSDIKINNENLNFEYQYKYDYYGKVHDLDSKVVTRYYLCSKIKLLNSSNKKTISAISLLKDLDIYPFDICFESILPMVDEFILGIDESSFNLRYKKILNTFLRQTKYRKKIKVKFFNFLSKTTKDCFIKARWIADVNNKLCNEAESKYLCYIQADEIFDYGLKKDIKSIIKEDRDELNINFFHFIHDFDHIRNPKYAAYNNLGRVYKKKLFTSTHDGCGFRKIDNKRSDVKLASENIYHIGYIYNYKKKISSNLNKKTGIFRLSKKTFFEDLNLIKVDLKYKAKLVKTINRYKYLNGYKNLKKFI